MASRLAADTVVEISQPQLSVPVPHGPDPFARPHRESQESQATLQLASIKPCLSACLGVELYVQYMPLGLGRLRRSLLWGPNKPWNFQL